MQRPSGLKSYADLPVSPSTAMPTATADVVDARGETLG